MLPNGVTVDGRKHDVNYDNRVVRLLRALYGLKQSPQLWNKELNRVLVDELNLTRASADACLYYYRNTQTGNFVLLVAEVDDLVITGTDEDKISEIKRDFTERDELVDRVRDLGHSQLESHKALCECAQACVSVATLIFCVAHDRRVSRARLRALGDDREPCGRD